MLDGLAVKTLGLRIAVCTLPGTDTSVQLLQICSVTTCETCSSLFLHYLCVTSAVCCRGICHKGKDCDYLHQLPTEYHEQLLTSDHTVDIFGRDKLAGSNMGTKGVGTYDRESKTLYVNYGGAGHLGPTVIRQLLQVRR